MEELDEPIGIRTEHSPQDSNTEESKSSSYFNIPLDDMGRVSNKLGTTAPGDVKRIQEQIAYSDRTMTDLSAQGNFQQRSQQIEELKQRMNKFD